MSQENACSMFAKIFVNLWVISLCPVFVH